MKRPNVNITPIIIFTLLVQIKTVYSIVSIIIAYVNIHHRPFLSENCGTQSIVQHHPRKNEEFKNATFHDGAHIKLSLVCQLSIDSSVICQLDILLSSLQMFSTVHTSSATFDPVNTHLYSGYCIK